MANLCSHGMTGGCIRCEERYGKPDPAQKRRALAREIWQAGTSAFDSCDCDPFSDRSNCPHAIAAIERVLAEQEDSGR